MGRIWVELQYLDNLGPPSLFLVDFHREYVRGSSPLKSFEKWTLVAAFRRSLEKHTYGAYLFDKYKRTLISRHLINMFGGLCEVFIINMVQKKKKNLLCLPSNILRTLIGCLETSNGLVNHPKGPLVFDKTMRSTNRLWDPNWDVTHKSKG